jgi:uncharacterized Zn ribbon protein
LPICPICKNSLCDEYEYLDDVLVYICIMCGHKFEIKINKIEEEDKEE